MLLIFLLFYFLSAMNSPIDTLEAEKAIRTLIRLTGDDPERSDLALTPKKVVEFYKSYFSYKDFDISDKGSARKINDYGQQTISLQGVEFISFCEHHMLPMEGKCYLSYIPKQYITGIGNAVKIVQYYARRLQIQERLTKQIAHALYDLLEPTWVEVSVSAVHKCLMCSDKNSSIKPKFKTLYSIGMPPL